MLWHWYASGVPDLEDKKLSELLRATTKFGVSEEDLKRYTKEMNDVIDSVIEFLSRRLGVLHCYVEQIFLYVYVTWSFIVSTWVFINIVVLEANIRD